MTNKSEKNQIIIHPAPHDAVLQQDYILRVRPAGHETWQNVPIFQVKVDMHDVRIASMAYFDFSGSVEAEITFPKFYTVYQVDIRPLSRNIQPKIEPKRITFTLNRPENLSIEINKDRFHNLHLFTNAIEETPDKDGENIFVVKGSLERPCFFDGEKKRAIAQMPENRLVYFEAGVHYVEEFLWNIPSGTRIYFEGGAILRGGLICENSHNIHISGRGMLYMAHLERYSGTHGLRISHSSDISVQNLIFVNPPHYTVCLGESERISLKNLRSFSCEGWSDGIDMMSCRDITVDGGFLRTSDDCIAIYGSRWDNHGDCRNITVKNISLWADVAHPLMIGTHGNHLENGDLIENITYENVDILEHHEFQAGYLGAMAINAGDKNTVRNVTYRNIRIEPMEHGKVLDLQVKWNRDYNPAPGREIRDILMEQIYVSVSSGEETSVISGYDDEHPVINVQIRDFYRDGRKTDSWEEANILIGNNVKNASLL